jgi:hypothetical protein
MDIISMIPVGYMAKRVQKRPGLAPCAHVIDIYSSQQVRAKISPTIFPIGSTTAIGSLTRPKS